MFLVSTRSFARRSLAPVALTLRHGMPSELTAPRFNAGPVLRLRGNSFGFVKRRLLVSL
jgi:hypothetical protein